MGVSTGNIGGQDGFRKAHREFRQAHENNTRILINLAGGFEEDYEAPPHDLKLEDNQWPMMIFNHDNRTEIVIGKPTRFYELIPGSNKSRFVTLEGPQRAQILKENAALLKEKLAEGWKQKAYDPKPIIAVMDPAIEKAMLMKRNQELEAAQINMNGMLAKLTERLQALEKAVN